MEEKKKKEKKELDDILYTVEEVAILLKVKRGYVDKLRKAGLLKFIKIGRHKCRKSTLDAFLEQWDGMDITDPYNPKELTA